MTTGVQKSIKQPRLALLGYACQFGAFLLNQLEDELSLILVGGSL
jgi:hypothetical protein